MSLVKSFSVGNGDMFYIEHGNDNFTVIDCCLADDTFGDIVGELQVVARRKRVRRFISTHPDDDHIRGLALLDDHLPLTNFYCVKNGATKEDATDDFLRYCELRNHEKAFYLSKGCTRKWMNQTDKTRGSSGIEILWPNTANGEFNQALEDVAKGLSPNNISPVIKYSCGSMSFLWMGDLETEFMENISDDLILPEITILFAPHHGRNTGRIPFELLTQLNPKVIVIGEAPSQYLNYYAGYNTITQNSADDIVFECEGEHMHIYSGSATYSVDFLDNYWLEDKHGCHYIGSI